MCQNLVAFYKNASVSVKNELKIIPGDYQNVLVFRAVFWQKRVVVKGLRRGKMKDAFLGTKTELCNLVNVLRIFVTRSD